MPASFTTIPTDPQTVELVLPLVLLGGLALTIPALLVVLNLVLGRWVHGRAPTSPGKDTPVECGLTSTVGTAGERFPVKFYLIAMLFLAFDIEVAFLYAWAWQFDKVAGWSMLWMLMSFLVLLEVGYLYLWRKGALDWDK
jgi:NADH-quinone oxidoreductase subunit A